MCREEFTKLSVLRFINFLLCCACPKKVGKRKSVSWINSKQPTKVSTDFILIKVGRNNRYMALLQCVEVHNGHVELFNSSRRVKRHVQTLPTLLRCMLLVKVVTGKGERDEKD